MEKLFVCINADSVRQQVTWTIRQYAILDSKCPVFIKFQKKQTEKDQPAAALLEYCDRQKPCGGLYDEDS